MSGRPPIRLVGKRALVTGAGSGIGRAIAIALADAGADVVAVGRDPERLAATARTLSTHGVRVETRILDLTRADEIERLGRDMSEAQERLDVLVHAAGAYVSGGPDDGRADDLAAMHATNVEGPKRLTDSVLEALQRSHGDVVVVNSSIVFDADRRNTAYGLTKQAMQIFADTLRAQVNKDGVRVLSVYPGRVATAMQHQIMLEEGRPYRPERLIQPEDVAALVVSAILMPRTAEVTDVRIRPMVKYQP